MDERTRQDIQAAVDGELHGPSLEAVEALFERSAEARALRDELRQITDWLGRLPPAEPPPDLHQRVVSAVSLPPVRLPSPSAANRLRDTLAGLFRYGLATAAGVVGTLIVVGQLERTSFLPPTGSADLSRMAGIVAPTARPAPILDRFELEADGVSAAVVLRGEPDGFRLELAMRADAPFDFALEWTNSDFELVTLALPQGGAFEGVYPASKRLAGTLQGSGDWAITFRGEVPRQGGGPRLVLLRDGSLLASMRLGTSQGKGSAFTP